MTLAKDKLHCVTIINTHGHFDHTGDNKRLKEVTGAKLVIHRADAPMILHQGSNGTMWGMEVEESPPPDVYVEERDVITFGDISLQVLHTPGHSPGGISLLSDKMVFVGDTLFAGSIGRTDLPGGDYETLIRSVKEKIFPLGDDVVIYPGHGPKTTVGQKKDPTHSLPAADHVGPDKVTRRDPSCDILFISDPTFTIGHSNRGVATRLPPDTLF